MPDSDTPMPRREAAGAVSAYCDPDALMTQREAAALLRLSERTMERHRTAGTGPRYLALGRAIRFRRRDVLDFIERNARQSTSERP
jgi:excisionase family DNA binding protein